MRRFLWTSLLIASVHYTAQGLLWRSQAMRLALALPLSFSWRYVSFPLFWILPRTLPQGSFWLIGACNSTLRGLAGSVVLWVASKRRALRVRSS